MKVDSDKPEDGTFHSSHMGKSINCDYFQITDRHIIEGQQVTYDEILNGDFNYYLQNTNITVISRTDGKFLTRVCNVLRFYQTVCRHGVILDNKFIVFFCVGTRNNRLRGSNVYPLSTF